MKVESICSIIQMDKFDLVSDNNAFTETVFHLSFKSFLRMNKSESAANDGTVVCSTFKIVLKTCTYPFSGTQDHKIRNLSPNKNSSLECNKQN